MKKLINYTDQYGMVREYVAYVSSSNSWTLSSPGSGKTTYYNYHKGVITSQLIKNSTGEVVINHPDTEVTNFSMTLVG